MDRIKRLLEVGYFPSQLPPSFVSRDLANSHASLYSDWLALQAPPKSGTKIPRAPYTKSELYSVARAGLNRRITSITNPVAQAYLATHIAQCWSGIVAHYRQSRLSKSRPRFLKGGSRAANIASMQALYPAKIAMSAGYRFMLRTDVSRFFPTIYTHSIPWAIHGKASAKKHTSPTPKYFGNLLDMSMRQCQDGQTIGLPIGPDTSHIIAEIIAVAVDANLKKKLKKSPAGFRYVDDYYLFFSTRAEADAALAALVGALQEFELQINFEKTKICSVIEITDDFWTHQLSSFEIARSAQKQLSDINHYFELAKDLAAKNADESVMTYALKRAASSIVRKENWAPFEAHVCHIAMAYPNTLQTIARLISTYARVAYPINRERLSRVVNAIIEDHAPLGHHSEVAWALWMVKELFLDLSEENIETVSDISSSVCALILMDLHAAGRLRKSPKFGLWKAQQSAAALHGELWLLSYEAGLRGWGSLSDAHILADPHFSRLHAIKAHFYDPMAVTKPFFHPSQFALERRGVSDVADLFELDDVDDLLEYDEGDGGYEGSAVVRYDGDDDSDF